MTSKSLALPGKPYTFKLGEIAKHIVFSVLVLSATTKFVVSGSKFLFLHSTDAKKDFKSIAAYILSTENHLVQIV